MDDQPPAGGSYIRRADGRLERVGGTDAAPAGDRPRLADGTPIGPDGRAAEPAAATAPPKAPRPPRPRRAPAASPAAATAPVAEPPPAPPATPTDPAQEG
jgi:hypothetical protein